MSVNDPAYEAAASRVMESHNAATSAYSKTAAILAAAMIQLRTHERGIEGHDDIVLQLKDTLLELIKDTYTKAADTVRLVPDYGDQARALATVDKLLELPYSARLTFIMHGYATAFKKSKMAVAILEELPDMLAAMIDDSLRKTVAFMMICDHAISNNILGNKRGELVNELAAGVAKAVELTEFEVNGVFDYACPELDVIAVKENQCFVQCLEAGHSNRTALPVANANLKAEINEVMVMLDKRAKGGE